MLRVFLCDSCKPGFDITKYNKLTRFRLDVLGRLLWTNQSPYLFTQFKEVNYPLNQSQLHLIWRRDVYAMFCHQVRSAIIPVFTPNLPLCDFSKWMRSASRICNMGYLRFMDTASHIARCTKDHNELFPCYKGLLMARISWGLVSAGLVWNSVSNDYAPYLSTVYNQVKSCVPLVYDHLRQTCRHGPPVVQLIQDLRAVLMIDATAMLSYGSFWHEYHIMTEEAGLQVGDHC